MNPQSKLNILKSTQIFLKKFDKEIDNCQSQFDYIDLIASVVAFKSVVVEHLKDNMLQDTSSIAEINQVINAIESAGEIVAKQIIVDAKAKHAETSKKENSMLN